MLVKVGGAWISNCVFSTGEIPEKGFPPAGTQQQFHAGQPLWGRCYLPEPAGANRPGELVDVVRVDGKPVWEQAYTRALPPDALGHSVPYSEVLRDVLGKLGPGTHRVVIEGFWRRGRREVRAYRGALLYSR
jgi:hypothetical protein